MDFLLVREVEEQDHLCFHLFVARRMVLPMQHQWRVVAPILKLMKKEGKQPMNFESFKQPLHYIISDSHQE